MVEREEKEEEEKVTSPLSDINIRDIQRLRINESNPSKKGN